MTKKFHEMLDGGHDKKSRFVLNLVQILATKLYRLANLIGLFRFSKIESVFIRLYFWYKSRLENFDMNLIEHLVSPGTTVVDVGANIGWFTINVSKFLGKGGCVVAVEPDEVNSRRFLKALEMFPAKSKVRFEPCALSNKSGFGILDLDPANPANHKITNMLLEGRLIKLKTLDELVESEKNISFVKIDVQGHELNVLEGGKHTLTKCKPAVVIEIDNTTNFLNPELIWDFMKSIGYRVYFIENQQLEVTKEMLLARKGYFDCICLPD